MLKINSNVKMLHVPRKPHFIKKMVCWVGYICVIMSLVISLLPSAAVNLTEKQDVIYPVNLNDMQSRAISYFTKYNMCPVNPSDMQLWSTSYFPNFNKYPTKNTTKTIKTKRSIYEPSDISRIDTYIDKDVLDVEYVIDTTKNDRFYDLFICTCFALVTQMFV